MPDQIPTPAEDLAALERVTEMAAANQVGMPGAEIVRRGLKWLRQAAINTGQDFRIGEQADKVFRLTDFDWESATHVQRGAAIRCVVSLAGFELGQAGPEAEPGKDASVGVEIVWPSPDSGEVAETSPADDTAPTAAPEEVRCEQNPDCLLVGPTHDGTKCIFLPTITPYALKPAAREKILAELAASPTAAQVPDSAHPRGIRDEAVNLARTPDGDPFGRPVPSRANMIAAAALLVLAVERMDGTR